MSEPAPPLRRRLVAIAFLDVVSYAALMDRNEDATLNAWSDAQADIVEPLAAAWRGRIANRTGDGLFVEFGSALDATNWALAVQSGLAARQTCASPLQTRIALHVGDVVDSLDGEVRGAGVNIAARLQTHARPGGIIASDAVANAVGAKTDAVFAELGLLTLRNIDRPVRAFEIVCGAVSPTGDPATEASTNRRLARPVRSVCRLLVLALCLGIPSPAPWSTHPAAAPNAGTKKPSLRHVAEKLLGEGRAVACNDHPCPRAWLASRALYERAIAADPTFGLPYAYAAMTYTNFIANDLSLDEEADLDKAEGLATDALALAPDKAETYVARAAVLADEPNRLEDALDALERAIAIDPNQPSARGLIGWLLIVLGRPAEAEPFLRRALSEAPTHNYAPAWLTYYGLAELFLRHKGYGTSQFVRAISLQSIGIANSEIALQRSINLAAGLALDGSIAEARRLATRLLAEHPSLTTHSAWACDCSTAAKYLAGVALIHQGMELAGIPK